MLWRVRTTLHDRPGALADLASGCGRAGVNILGLQIFPGVDRVTDELVLRTPEGWGLGDLVALVESAGGTSVSALPCTEAALGDQPTRYVVAARSILEAPASFPDVAARLFDAEPDAAGEGDLMDLEVDDVSVQLRRTAAFTGTELARGAALAALVTEVLHQRHAPRRDPDAVEESATTYVVAVGRVSALVDGAPVGDASWHRVEGEEPAACRLELAVDPAWRRRGIGSGLLREAALAAFAEGVEELVVRTAADNQAVLPLVLGTGMRGRIRMAADELTVRIPIRQLSGAR
ncbi:GNAT family N-acetyltransferase [Nocardioides euryhalodurans]|uniref:GNAT family N-acetyltransferase n=1 Tax=Nocardioides euryhalodurans TaxID=2518370 RepID=A0A4P7GK37_9ACTN|nr:GNAT family N-acetyltransferase [Nocardioides euryhalodurans]QBR92149.1 GNAT family N-acetyltransferase [Nocardioides euryhalodurans]